MNRNARLAAYATVLGLMFGGGVALGAATGPDPKDPPSNVGHDGSTGEHDEESDH